MRRPTYQFFSLDEYQGRLDALRSRMEQRGVDVLLVTTARTSTTSAATRRLDTIGTRHSSFCPTVSRC